MSLDSMFLRNDTAMGCDREVDKMKPKWMGCDRVADGMRPGRPSTASTRPEGRAKPKATRPAQANPGGTTGLRSGAKNGNQIVCEFLV